MPLGMSSSSVRSSLRRFPTPDVATKTAMRAMRRSAFRSRHILGQSSHSRFGKWSSVRISSSCEHLLVFATSESATGGVHERSFAAQLAAQLAQYKVEVVCGPLVEGAFVALLVSLELGCDFAYAERFADTTREGLYPVEYRLPRALQPAVKGKRVAVVNDIISAGSAVRGTFSDLQALGADVVAVGALLALGDAIGKFTAEHHVALELLERMPNNLWMPSECPLCAAGVQLEIAGTS